MGQAELARVWTFALAAVCVPLCQGVTLRLVCPPGASLEQSPEFSFFFIPPSHFLTISLCLGLLKGEMGVFREGKRTVHWNRVVQRETERFLLREVSLFRLQCQRSLGNHYICVFIVLEVTFQRRMNNRHGFPAFSSSPRDSVSTHWSKASLC